MPGIIEDQMGAMPVDPNAMPPQGMAAPVDPNAMPPQGMAAPGAVEGQAAPGVEGEAPTGAEQESYDKILMATSKILYDKKTNGSIMQVLEAGKADPPQAVAQVVAMILQQLDEKSGGSLDVSLFLPVSAEMAEMVGELGQEAGMFEYTEAEHSVTLQHVVKILGEQYGADPADVKQLLDTVTDQEKVQMAEQQGAHAQARQPGA